MALASSLPALVLQKDDISLGIMSIKKCHRVVIRASQRSEQVISVNNEAENPRVLEFRDALTEKETEMSLETTPSQCAWVSACFLSICETLSKSASAALASPEPVQALGVAALSGLCGYILADFATGVYHWALDNYGDANTPIFGYEADIFQGHHKKPWTITQRNFINNTYRVARPITCFLLPIAVWKSPDISADAFLAVFLACGMMTQHVHAWAHTPKSKLPRVVVALQDAGLLLPRDMHWRHHRCPYDCNYCVFSGIWNSFLNKIEFFPQVERAVHKLTGITPHCWQKQTQHPYFLGNDPKPE